MLVIQASETQVSPREGDSPSLCRTPQPAWNAAIASVTPRGDTFAWGDESGTAGGAWRRRTQRMRARRAVTAFPA